MEFRILGPLEVWEAGQALTLSGAKVGRAAVTQQPYFDWLHHRDRESGGGLYGLKSVGQQLGAVCSRAFESENYCLLGSGSPGDLPSFLVAYFERYSAQLS